MQASNSISVVGWFFYEKFHSAIYTIFGLQNVISLFVLSLLMPATEKNKNFKFSKISVVSKCPKNFFLSFSVTSSNLNKTYFMVDISSYFDVNSIVAGSWYFYRQFCGTIKYKIPSAKCANSYL